MAGTKVVLVEDDAAMLIVCAQVLIRKGYDVLPAATSRRALEIIIKHRSVDLLVSDIGLPEMPGTELMRHVQALSPWIAVVLMTGGEIDWSAVPSGVPVLKKPFAAADLIMAVQDALARAAEARANSVRQFETAAVPQKQSAEVRTEIREAVHPGET